jgi:alkylation response protein AidB-like acyl-CoA dehydrogenase
MPVFNIERLGNAARSLGYGQRAFRLAAEYAQGRRQFGKTLSEFQGLRWRFAEMRLQLDSAQLLLYRAASAAANGVPRQLDTALAKWACNEAAYKVTDASLQIFGGTGLSAESELPYLLARTRAWLVAGGSVEILRDRVAREIFER